MDGSGGRAVEGDGGRGLRLVGINRRLPPPDRLLMSPPATGLPLDVSTAGGLDHDGDAALSVESKNRAT